MADVMNDVQQSTDPKSPTTLVMEYLRTKGVAPGSPRYAQAVREALQENARNDGKLIPGLRNQDPGEADPDVGTGSGSVARKIEGGGTPDSPPDRRASGGDGGGDPKTSARPPGAAPTIDESQYSPAGPAIDRAVSMGPVAGDFPPAPTVIPQDPELGPGGAMGASAPGVDALAATAGIGLPSLANLILGNRGAQVPPIMPSQGPVAGPPIAPAPGGGLGAGLVPQGAVPPPITPSGNAVPLTPSAGAGVQPNVPFQSPGPRVPPPAGLPGRVTPPGINFTPPTGASPVTSSADAMRALLRSLGGAAKAIRP